MHRNKKVPGTILAVIIAFCAAAPALHAIDFSLKPGGFALIPLGPGSESDSGDPMYEPGGGGGLGFDVDLSSVWPTPFGLGYTVGLEGGLSMASKKADGSSVQLYGLGGGLGLYFFPLSRLYTRLDGAAGIYSAILDEGKTKPGLWWRGGLEAGFRFTPNFTLAVSGGYKQYQNSGKSGVLYSGVYAGLTAVITFEIGEQSGGDGVTVTLAQDGGVYPALLSLYQSNQIGAVTIRNNENAEIRNVRVSFRAGRYTASEFQCGAIGMVPKGRSSEVPLYADFSSDVLQFADSGRIIGEIVIRYSFLGKEKTAVAAASIEVNERGSFPDGDNSSLAAFVSPTSPEVLEFAKNVTGQARNERRTGLNGNMQFALWLFEGLRTYKPIVTPAASTVQFPSQTLYNKTGMARDWGLLYAAALEASGISAGYIPLNDGSFITVINLGITEQAAATLFDGTDNILIINDEVWLPVLFDNAGACFADTSGGFNPAWKEAGKRLNEIFAANEEVELYTLADTWTSYPPAPFPALGATIAQADSAALQKGAAASLDAYITSDIKPLIASVTAQIRTAPTAALYNRLGILNVRAGDTKAARAAFQKAADMGSTSAKRNLENLK